MPRNQHRRQDDRRAPAAAHFAEQQFNWSASVNNPTAMDKAAVDLERSAQTVARLLYVAQRSNDESKNDARLLLPGHIALLEQYVARARTLIQEEVARVPLPVPRPVLRFATE